MKGRIITEEIITDFRLTEQDMYGLDLAQQIKERTHGAFADVYGRVYIPLFRMEELGLISSHKEVIDKKNVRHRYHIEDSGKEYLEFGKNQSRMVLTEYLNNI